MKKLAIVGLMVLGSNFSWGQTWCPPGAEWWYVSTADGGFDVYHYWYFADSTLGGRTAKVVRSTLTFEVGGSGVFPGDDEITSNEEGVLWKWSHDLQEWDTLLWFDCGFEQHWNSPFENCTSNHRHSMQDTGRVTVDGSELKFWEYRVDYLYWDEPYSYSGRFIDRLGIDASRLPIQWCDGTGPHGSYYFRCYQDEEIQYRSAEYEAIYGPACPIATEVHMTSSTDDIRQPFPNPGTEQFTLSNLPSLDPIMIVDASGRVVLQQAITSPIATVDASALAPGIYTIRQAGTSAVRWLKQ